MLDPRHAVYVGSFDPPTLGHLDIIERGSRIYDRVTVGIGMNPDKVALFSSAERLALMREMISPMSNVSAMCFEGLTVDFVRECEAAVMLRGVRTLTDIEAEFTLTLANRSLASDLETVFLMAAERYTSVSSTLIRQIARMGRSGEDVVAEQLRRFVPEAVIGPLLEKYRSGGQ